MIDGKNLNRCIDILSELNANATSRRDRELILEVGYILKQEYDIIKEWENSQNRDSSKKGVKLDANKLLEDNIQLCKENATLLKDVAKMKDIIESKIPLIIESKIPLIEEDLGVLIDILSRLKT